MVLRRRLLLEDVQCSARDLTILEGLEQVFLVHDAAACRVDDEDALLGLAQVVLVNKVLRLLNHGHVDGNKIALRKERVQVDQLYALLSSHFLRHIEVISQHLHAEGDSLLGDDHPYVPYADDAQRLVVDLDAHKQLLLPLAFLHRAVGERHLSGEGEHKGHGMLRRSQGVALRACS